MSNENNKFVTLTDNQTGDSTDLPLLGGSIGPNVIDIRSLYAKTGHFSLSACEHFLGLA